MILFHLEVVIAVVITMKNMDLTCANVADDNG